MKAIKINNKIIQVYDSIDEMPIVNFQKYNKYLLIDSGIGSDVDDIDSHIVKIAKFINLKDSKKALQELQNMRQNLYMINSEISPKYLAFAALIHSINGKRVTNLSDDNLKAILKSISEVKHSAIIDFMMWLKKKVASELELYFPNEFVNPKEKEAYDKLRSRTLLVLEEIVKDTDNSDKIDVIDEDLFSSYAPKVFCGSKSVEIKYDKQFESACLLIAQETNMDAKKMTVLQFYNAIDNIKRQAENKEKNFKRNKRR